METIFTIPWALNGEFDEVPLKIQEDGSVSFEEGFGLDYQKDLSQDPNAKNIERKHLNYILNTICNAINLINERTLLNNFLVGVPVPWPLDTIPDQCLKCNGSIFDTVKYSELAAIYVDGKTPDLRGEFIRGYDDGRGADPDRILLSSQGDAIRNITAYFRDIAANKGIEETSGAAFIAWRWDNNTNVTTGQTTWSQYDIGFDASRQVPVSYENRPRNVAFNYIMRAY